jgi:integrase
MKNQRPTTAKTRRGNRVYRNKYVHNGEEQHADDYSFRIKKAGEHHRLNLGSNLEPAKKLADQIQAFMSVPSNGFVDLFESPDFECVPKPRVYLRRRMSEQRSSGTPENEKIIPLLSDVIAIYEANTVHLSRTTVTNNLNAIRHIGAGILGLRKLKRSATKKQRLAWRAKVGNVPLNEISIIALESYRTRVIRAAGEDGVARGKAITTLNTYFRCAKSLFAERVLPLYESLALPEPIPLRELKPLREPSRRYVSNVDVSEIIKLANEEFWAVDTKIVSNDGRNTNVQIDRVRHEKIKFVILLLTISCGLRPKEVSWLTWEQIDFGRKQISVAVTSYDTPKARSSEAAVDVSETVLEYLREFQDKYGTQPFVVPCGSSPNSKPVKRAQGVFRELYKWLRKQGIDSDTPLYVFRKEAGSIIFDQTESFDMAAEFLRNDPRIAREHYVGRKRRLHIEVPGLASLSD